MPFWIFGRKGKGTNRALSQAAASHGRPLTMVRIAGAATMTPRSFGRRDVSFHYNRVFIPSLIIDYTELVLRQAGVQGEEGFVLWAGTLSDKDAHITTVVVPELATSSHGGEVTADATAKVLSALDSRDLVPVLQVHTHPRSAFLSATDSIRPLVAVSGFMSVVIPNFGFVDLADVQLWSAHEYLGPMHWRELPREERVSRLVIDDSVIWVSQ